MSISRKTRINWLLDASVFISAIFAGLSGVYFLLFPTGGYEGGRNIWYEVTVIFDRHTWDDIHTWSSVAVIIAIVIHLAYHWQWAESMIKKVANSFGPRRTSMSRGGKINLLVNLLIGSCFLLTALSGIYLLFAPSGGYQGGGNAGWDPGFIFSRTVWDLIHTWSGVVLMIAAMLHFVIHWRWIVNVTARFFSYPLGKRAKEPIHVSR